MPASLIAMHVAGALVLPIFVLGLINRVKARWAGRRGPPILQPWFDLRRLLKKGSVYSETTSLVFRLGPLVMLATTLVTTTMVPIFGRIAPWTFAFDFVAIAYLWGLGRFFLVLSALDTGSAFEGMGASREAIFGALVEPALFLAFGTLLAATGSNSLSLMVQALSRWPQDIVVAVGCLIALFVVLLVEAARVPVDDPNTHLELTMIHEVMILDHSGPDLAALQYSAGLRLTLGAALIAAIIDPVPLASPWVVAALRVALIFAVAVVIGCVESVVARLRLRTVPQLIFVGFVGALIALIAAVFSRSGTT